MIENAKQWEGQLLNGKFTLRRFLGGSDRCAVFLVDETAGGRALTSVRLVDASVAGADDQLTRWEAVSKLSHPSLIRICETGRGQVAGNEVLYAVTEYAEENLAQILPERALTVDEARQVLEAVLAALTYIHSQGLVHGRLKPSNILAVGDVVKISSDTLCPSGQPLILRARNTAYDAPEVQAGTLAPPADVWSLGVTLVEAITQHLPVLDTRQKQPALPQGIPQPLREIIENCLQVDPARRWTVAQIAARLRPEKPQAAFPPVPQPAARTSTPGDKQSTKWIYAMALVVVVILVVVLIARPKPPASERTAAPVTESKTAAGQPASAGATTVASPSSATGSGPAASAGEVVQRVMPQVSPGARRTITGRIRVLVRVNVDEAGNVTDARLKSSGPSRYFASHALEAARGWKFRPPQVNGRAAASQWDVRFTFSRRAIDGSAERSKP